MLKKQHWNRFNGQHRTVKFLFLITAEIRRHPGRTTLNFFSAFLAFFLLGVMSGVLGALDELVDSLDEDRIRVVSRAGFGQQLPFAHAPRIRQLEHVTVVATALAFPGYFQDPANAFGGAAVEFGQYLTAFKDDFTLTESEREQLRSTRNGATVGAVLAERFGWQVGDQIPLTSTYLVNEDGTKTWPVKIISIHNAGPDDDKILASEVYVNLDYIDEFRADENGFAHMFVVTKSNDFATGELISQIDHLFTNSGAETRSFPEDEFFTNRLQRVGNINGIIQAILWSVFFALLLALGGALVHSTNRRRREFATLHAIGFSTGRTAFLIFAESFLLVGSAALLGLGIAAFIFPALFAQIGIAHMSLASSVWILGIATTMALSTLVALRPALMLSRLEPAQLLTRS
ncbi:MAG: FtsX-like permease family protein [Pseudomonadales bacterium]|nr:FtsX-like permease family protein [Pseudomonadales bacterium]